MADAELGIARGLGDEIFATGDQAAQPSAVRPLSGGLPFDLLARGGFVKLFRREFAQLLVRFVQLQFAIAHFQRLPLPLA